MLDLTNVLRDTQGNTLSGFGRHLPVGHFFLLNVAGSPQAARNWLKKLLPAVKSDLEWRNPEPYYALNIAFTYEGLLAFGIPDAVSGRLPVALTSGMYARAREFIGDSDENDRGHWEPWWLGDDLRPAWVRPVHVLLAVYARDPLILHRQTSSLRAHLRPRPSERGRWSPWVPAWDTKPLEIVAEEPVGFPYLRPQGGGAPGFELREHFGYLDGAGEPDIEGVSQAYRATPSLANVPQPEGRAGELGTWDPARGEWRPLKPGEFVFGLENEGGGVTPAPRESDRKALAEFECYRAFMAHGTFLVYRKLQQRVGAFREFLKKQEKPTGMPRELLAAKLVGRWPNAAPLKGSPTLAEAEKVMDRLAEPGAPRAPLNAFRYADDPDGREVPLGAHVRRANPRDTLPGDRTDVKRRRMLRRGIPYGAPHVPWDAPPPANDEGANERGLIFIALQTNIAGQFEAVQREWLNDGDIFGQGRDRDPLTSGKESRMILPGANPPVLTKIPPFVRVRGGAYFFKPGLAALKAIATQDYNNLPRPRSRQ